MTNDVLRQVDAFITPGTLLRTARQARGLDEKEVAERLNWIPGYVAVIERDDYQALRRPAFARGYIKAYGKLVGVDEAELLCAFEQYEEGVRELGRNPSRSGPPQLHRTGPGVVIGLVVLLLLVLALWWWQRGGESGAAGQRGDAAAGAVLEVPGDTGSGADE